MIKTMLPFFSKFIIHLPFATIFSCFEKKTYTFFFYFLFKKVVFVEDDFPQVYLHMKRVRMFFGLIHQL